MREYVNIKRQDSRVMSDMLAENHNACSGEGGDV